MLYYKSVVRKIILTGVIALSQRQGLDHTYFEGVYFEKRVWVPSAKISNYLMMFTKLYIGENDELGKASFRDILITLSESELVPRTLVFWNNAVKACVEGSPLVPTLNKIERLGVRILVAGHALEQLELKSEMRAGKLANHFDLIEALSKVQKVVSL
ncbi:MAG: hypothetical protein ACQETH_05740 [Candidatus Rifleibacteriota bacterium]